MKRPSTPITGARVTYSGYIGERISCGLCQRDDVAVRSDFGLATHRRPGVLETCDGPHPDVTFLALLVQHDLTAF